MKINRVCHTEHPYPSPGAAKKCYINPVLLKIVREPPLFFRSRSMEREREGRNYQNYKRGKEICGPHMFIICKIFFSSRFNLNYKFYLLGFNFLTLPSFQNPGSPCPLFFRKKIAETFSIDSITDDFASEKECRVQLSTINLI